MALGVGADAAAPLGPGLLQGWRGRLAFQALRGGLPGGIELRPISGMIRGDGASLAVDKLAAKIGGGEAKGDLSARRSADGVAFDARLQWSGVDGAALHYRGLAMPEGKTALQMTLASSGRSAAALAANLSGGGQVTLEREPDRRARSQSVRCRDARRRGRPADRRPQTRPDRRAGAGARRASRWRRRRFRFQSNRAGCASARRRSTARRARIVVSGGYDIAADQADLRAVMTMASPAAGAFRPEIQLLATGTPDALQRQVDVAALSSWLATRRIDSEIQRLQAIEQSEAPMMVAAAFGTADRRGRSAGGEYPAARSRSARGAGQAESRPASRRHTERPRTGRDRAGCSVAAADHGAAGAGRCEAAAASAIGADAAADPARSVLGPSGRNRLTRTTNATSAPARRARWWGTMGERKRPRSMRGQTFRFDFRHRLDSAGAEVIQHEQPDRRGQIALLAVAVDLSDQLGQCHVAQARDFLHAIPERLFEADAGFVACNYDRPFYDRRFHDASPVIRC